MKKRVITAGAGAFLLALLLQSQTAAEAVREGLALCGATVVPSLFPFFVAVSLVIRLGVVSGRGLERLMGPLFGLSGACALPLAAGLVGGYPSGARAAAQLWRQGVLSREEAEGCLSFVNNCGPAFVISYVGVGIFGSLRVGVVLYAVHALSALLTGVLLARRHRPAPRGCRPPQTGDVPLGQAVTEAVTSSVEAVLRICGFVVFFSVVIRLAELPAAAAGAVEMVSGLAQLPSTGTGMAAASGILAWGGLSVHCQTMAVLEGLSPARHWVGKALHCLLAAALTLAALAVGML